MAKKKSLLFSPEWPTLSKPSQAKKKVVPETPPSLAPPPTVKTSEISKSSEKPLKTKPDESRSIKLAQKIVGILRDEEPQDSVRALQIAKILLPSAADRRKIEQKREEEDDRELAEGDLEPADEMLMKYSKVMGRTLPEKEADTETVLGLE